MKKLFVIFAITGSISLNSQNEFDKYGPLGSRVYTDLKEAVKLETPIYKMDLSYKKLDPKLYEKLSKIKDLQALKLSGNEVKEFPPNFGDLYNLVYFASYNNPFTAFPPDFKKLANLTHLELSGTKIDSIPAAIAYNSRLKAIKFTDTEDSLKLPVTLKYMKSLEDVQFENCILDSFPKQVFKIPNLKFLYLAKTNTYYINAHFDKLPNLEVFILENNPISTIPYNIYQAKSLRVMSLRNNKLTKLPASISQMENLALLDLRGNPISMDYIEELKAMLPGCEIKFDAPKPQ